MAIILENHGRKNGQQVGECPPGSLANSDLSFASRNPGNPRAKCLGHLPNQVESKVHESRRLVPVFHKHLSKICLPWISAVVHSCLIRTQRNKNDFCFHQQHVGTRVSPSCIVSPILAKHGFLEWSFPQRLRWAIVGIISRHCQIVFEVKSIWMSF